MDYFIFLVLILIAFELLMISGQIEDYFDKEKTNEKISVDVSSNSGLHTKE
jgi:Na+-transporting methylmalonyl-CoA/oxaloacetate decarboxylase gamma subunit